MNLSKRNALSLSAVLAATVVTGGAAIFGLSHAPAVAHPTGTTVLAQPAAQAAPAQNWEANDR